MQLLKRVGLGLMFWVGGTIGFLILGIIIGVVPGSATTGPVHAIGVGAIIGSVEEATVFNPDLVFKGRWGARLPRCDDRRRT